MQTGSESAGMATAMIPTSHRVCSRRSDRHGTTATCIVLRARSGLYRLSADIPATAVGRKI
eukprot:654010-Rhodomonas_salina.1